MNLIPSERGTIFIFFCSFLRNPSPSPHPCCLFWTHSHYLWILEIFTAVTVSCHQWSLIEIHSNVLLLKFTQSKNWWGCKIFAHLLCNGKLYLKTNFSHSRYIFTPPFLFNLQKFSRLVSTFSKMHSEVVFRVLWKHIFHELLFILSQNRNYYIDRFSFHLARKIFLRNFFLTGVNIKILILTAVKIS